MRRIGVSNAKTSELEDILDSLPNMWKQFRPFLSASLRPVIRKVWLGSGVTHAAAAWIWSQDTIAVIFEYNEAERTGEFEIEYGWDNSLGIRNPLDSFVRMLRYVLEARSWKTEAPLRFVVVVCAYCGAKYPYIQVPSEIICQNCARSFVPEIALQEYGAQNR